MPLLAIKLLARRRMVAIKRNNKDKSTQLFMHAAIMHGFGSIGAAAAAAAVKVPLKYTHYENDKTLKQSRKRIKFYRMYIHCDVLPMLMPSFSKFIVIERDSDGKGERQVTNEKNTRNTLTGVREYTVEF